MVDRHALRVLHPLLHRVAQVLAEAVRQIGSVDLVMVGRESGDWGVGQTGGLLAEELGLPCVSFVDRLEKREGGLLLWPRCCRCSSRISACR